MGGGIHGEDALSKLSHTATVCVAGFFIDPNPNRLVGPNFFYCMLPSPLCSIFQLGSCSEGWLKLKSSLEKPCDKCQRTQYHTEFASWHVNFVLFLLSLVLSTPTHHHRPPPPQTFVHEGKVLGVSYLVCKLY